MPRHRGRDRRAHRRRGERLDQVPGRAGLGRALDRARVGVGGDEDHRAIVLADELARGLDAVVAVGEVDVHQHEVGRGAGGERARLGGVHRGPDDVVAQLGDDALQVQSIARSSSRAVVL